ncbi:MAG: hypothetical protein HY816_03125 [Candidatus Wallbacteria bacterium]|nr:hypothetical protein [Candidatus Wallbacteria bacterium]
MTSARWTLLAAALTAALTGPGLHAAEPEAKAVILFLSDTYGCLGYPGWPGGVARLVQTVRQQRSAHPDAVLLHTGNAVSPFYYSRFDKGKLYTSSIDQAGGVVWNLGFHDLDYGWAHLSALRAGMRQTAVLSSNLEAASDKPEPWLVREVGGLKVGFCGLMEPRAEHLARLGALAGMKVRSPIETVREVVLRHRASVDVLVVVADLEEPAAEELARQAEGVDLILAGSRHEKDWYTFYQGRPPRQVLTRRRTDGKQTVLLSGPRDGFELGKVTVRARRGVRGWEVASVEPEVIPLKAEAPQDPKIWSAVQKHLQEMEAQKGTALVDKLAERFPKGFDGNRLTRWILGGLRTAMRAEVAVLNQGALFKVDHWAETAWKAGRLTDLELDSIFWADNEVVRLKVLGKHLLQLLEDDAGSNRLEFAGLVRKDGAVIVNGRKLKADEHYLVATSNFMVADSPKSRGLAAALSAASRFSPDEGHWEADEKGKTVLLRDAFAGQLTRWAAAHPAPDGAEPFETPDCPEQRSVIFRNLTFNYSDYDARNNQKFPRVRNPAIATADVRTVQGTGEVILRDTGARARRERGMAYRFTELEFPGPGVVANPVDDLVFYERYTDRSRTVASRFFPYAELAYDTEFTPTTGNPRDQLYRLSVGLTESLEGPVKGLRFGLLAEHDRSALVNTEYGIGAGFHGSVPFGDIRFESETDARYYFRDGADTADDLLYEIYSNNQLVVPVTSELALTFSANVFAYRGKVVDEDGANLFLGMGLRFDKLWKTRHEDFSE